MKRLGRVLLWILKLVGRLVGALINAVYKTLTRTALYLATGWLVIYFTVNSGAFNTALMTILGDVMPGSFEVGALQWGPLPQDVTLLDTTIKDPSGVPVIRVRRVTAAIDMLAMWSWTVRQVLMGEQPIELIFTQAHTEGADVLVEVGDDGWTGLAAAFDDPSKPLGEPGNGHTIIIDGAVVKDGRVRVTAVGAGVEISGNDLDILARVVIVNGKVTVLAPRMDSMYGTISVAGAGPGGETLNLAYERLQTPNVLWDDGRLELVRATMNVNGLPITTMGRIDTKPTVEVHATAAIEGVSSSNTLIAAYLGDLDLHFDADVTVLAEGPFSWPHAVVRVEARRLDALGLTLGPIDLELALRRDPYLQTAELGPLSLDIDGAVLHLDRAAITLLDHGDTQRQIDLHARLEGVVPERLWDLGLLVGDTPAPGLLGGHYHGALQAGVAQRYGARATNWDITAALRLDGYRDATVDTLPVNIGFGIHGSVDAHFDTVTDHIRTHGLHVWSKDDVVDLSGRVDLLHDDSLGLDLALNAKMDLGTLLKRLDVKDINGVAHLTEAHVTGTLLSPNVSGRLKLTRSSAMDLGLRDVGAEVDLVDGRVMLRNLRGSTEWGRLRTNADLHIWRKDVTDLHPTMPLRLTDLTATGVDLSKLKIADLRGTANARSRDFSLALRKDGLDPRGTASLEVKNLGIIGETFKAASANVTVTDSMYKVKRLSLTTDKDATITADGEWSVARKTLNARVKARQIDLAALAILKRYDLPLRGLVGLDLTAKGRLDTLAVKGTVRTRGFAYGGLFFGNAVIDLDRPRGSKRVRMNSTDFFDHMTLKTGVLHLDKKGVPTRVEVAADVEDLDVPDILTVMKGTVAQAHIRRAEASLMLDFTGAPMRLSIVAPDGAAALQASEDGPIITNRGVLATRIIGGTVSVDRLVVDALGQRLGVCGTVTLEEKRLMLDIAGDIDLRKLGRLEALKSAVTDLDGRLVTAQGKSPVSEPFRASCLRELESEGTLGALGDPTGFIRVGRTLAHPAISGGLRFDKVRALPRGLGKELSLTSGTLLLDTERGIQKAWVPADAPLRGTLDEGTIRISGGIALPDVDSRDSLATWIPDSGDLRIAGEDITWAVPREYTVTLDPDVRLIFKDVYDPDTGRLTVGKREKAKVALKGSVNIVEGEFNKSFSVFTRAIGSVLGRSVDAYSVSLAERLPFLNDVELDLKVTGGNFLIQSDVGVASTDLETGFKLRAGGTFEHPSLSGTVEVTDGTVTYNVVTREFEVTRGVLTFDGDAGRPILDVTAETSIERTTDSVSGASSVEDQYIISVRVKGRVPDYTIEFDSKPTLAQIDIQYLILTGSTKSDLDRGGTKTTSTLNLLSANLGSLLTSLISAPFVEKIDVAPLIDGGGQAQLLFRLGRNIRLGVTSRTTGSTTTYDTSYRHKLRDNLVLEARRRGAGSDEQDRDRYEVQLKVTVPID